MSSTLKIKIKKDSYLYASTFPKIIEKGDWIDLYTAEQTEFRCRGDFQYISLGVAIQLPDGFEAIVAPRSSTPSKYGIIMPNSIGIIDNSYCSDKDIWKMPALCMRTGGSEVPANTRICQFRIQLSQKATFWQKFKWLFSSGIELVEVDHLNNPERGGFGSTGVK